MNRSLLVVVLIATAAYAVAYVALEDVAMALIVLAVTLCGLPFTTNWRLMIPVIFFYMTVSGLISNILYPNKLPLLLLDMCVIVLYGGFIMSHVRTSKLIPPVIWNRSFLVVVGLAIAQMMNPALPTGISGILVGIVGLKVLLFHVPLAVIGYHYVQVDEEFWKLIRLVLLFSMPVAALGLFSVIFGLDWYSDFGEGTQRAIVRTPGQVHEQFDRVAGSFSRPQNYGLYCFTIAVIGSMTTMLRKGTSQKLGLVAMLFAIFGIIISGSRAPIAWFIIASMITLLFINRDDRRSMSQIINIGMVILFCSVFIFPFTEFNIDIYINRFESLFTLGAGDRVRTMFFLRLEQSFEDALFGLGTGSGSVASRHVVGRLLTTIVESEYLRFMVEFGLVGFVAAIWWYFILARRSIMIRIRLRTIRYRIVAAFIGGYVITVLVSGLISTQIDQAPTAIFFWFFLGVLAKLPEIEKGELDRARLTG